MKLLLVNTVAEGGSIPAYMRTIADEALARGHEVGVAKGRRGDMSGVTNITIGTRLDTMIHGVATRLLDRHGLAGRGATLRFIRDAERFGPDVIHLHNIHGYYLHYPTLFEWLAGCGRPVVWTLHDAWAFTGHCAFYDGRYESCRRWETGCGHCPMTGLYPASVRDRSRANLRRKAEVFTSVPQLTLLPVSEWLAGELERSVLRDVPRQTIKIDLDTELFKPCGVPGRRRVLGAAANWNVLKAPDFFTRLRRELPDDVEIRLLGRYDGRPPEGITLGGVVHDRAELAREYSAASVFVNASYAENYPQALREALGCGAPVVCRATGGSLEDISQPGAPIIGARTDDELIEGVRMILADESADLRERARRTAVEAYGRRPNLRHLFELYESLSRR